MIIEIESYFGNKIVSGKVRSLRELRRCVKDVLKESNHEDFTSIFCARYNFDILTYDEEIMIDCCIDLDTQTVFKPQYD